MDITIHIGLPKTATTYLQSSVFPLYDGYLGKFTNDTSEKSLARDFTRCAPVAPLALTNRFDLSRLVEKIKRNYPSKKNFYYLTSTLVVDYPSSITAPHQSDMKEIRRMISVFMII